MTLTADSLREVLDQALASAKGIRIKTGSASEAMALRHRLNRLRKKDREVRKELGMSWSDWDELMLVLDGATVVVKKPEKMVIEEIVGDLDLSTGEDN